MAIDTAPESGTHDSPYSDEAGRPIGEYQPSALERLNRLHNEAVETSELAHLLARVPFAAGALGAGCAALLFASAGSVAAIMLGLWACFVATAIVAMMRVARRAALSPVDLLTLRASSLDLNAAMLYAGFSWGAGAFIGMPAAASMSSLLAFTIGGGLALSAILRSRGATSYFLIPNVALAAAAAFFGNIGMIAAATIVILGMGLIGAIELFERYIAYRARTPIFPFLTIS